MEPREHPATATVHCLTKTKDIRILDYQCCAGPDDKPETEYHTHNLIAIVRSGVFCYRVDGSEHLLGPGSVLLGNAGKEYTCSHDYGTGDLCTVFVFPTRVLDEVKGALGFRSASRNKNPFIRPYLPRTPRIEALHHLAWGCANHERPEFSVDELAYEIATAALSRLAESKIQDHQVSIPINRRINRDRVYTATDYLDTRFKDPVGLSDVAATVNLSPYHFLRLFRHEVGLTPHQYLIGVRLRHAIQLLRDTSWSVTDIAYEAGFEDLSNFIRTFHRHIGCSPRSFRRGMQFGSSHE